MTRIERESRSSSGQLRFGKRVWDARDQLKNAGIVDYADKGELERPTCLSVRGRELAALPDNQLALVLWKSFQLQ